MNLKDLPAIYATQPYPGVSSSYVFIPTRPVVEGLQESGWEVVDARQTKSRSELRAPYARHMLRFRHPAVGAIKDPRGQNLQPELVFINGHDGSATYRLFAGLFSFLCLNGLVVGSVLGGASIRHSGISATMEAVQYGAIRIINEEMPLLAGMVDTMSKTLLGDSKRHDFARHALELRYRGVPSILTTDQVLEVHRPEDAANDVWTTLNVIQENILSRKHEGRSFTGRRSSIRGVKAIAAQTSINRGLWDYGMKLAA